MADYYRYRDLEEDMNFSDNRKKSFINWKMSDGSKIKATKMTKQHLINSIAKIKIEAWRLDWLETLEEELASRK